MCLPIIQRIYHKMVLGVKFDYINVSGDSVINRDHRYICCVLLKRPVQQNSWASPSHMTIYRWPDIFVDVNDWESKEMIARHNIKDAARSGLAINSLYI